MAHGILGIIACPMLEDELIYSLANDPDEKDIYVLDTPYNGSLKRKMDQKGVPYRTMDEWDFMNANDRIDRNRLTVAIRMMNLALHSEPKDLMKRIQDDMIMLQGRVDAVGLYYGMCGNYGWDITKWAEQHLSYPAAVFRDDQGRVCDDCVGVAVGGLCGYQRLIKEFTGVMLFTPAVATNWVDFMSAGEMVKGVLDHRDPQKSIKEILEICGYRSVVQIDTGLEDRKEFDEATKEFADYMGFEILQASSDYADLGPAKRLYAEAKSMLPQ